MTEDWAGADVKVGQKGVVYQPIQANGLMAARTGGQTNIALTTKTNVLGDVEMLLFAATGCRPKVCSSNPHRADTLPLNCVWCK